MKGMRRSVLLIVRPAANVQRHDWPFGGGQEMRAIMIEPTANGTVLTLADIAGPALGPAQIRIGVRAASVNRADLAQRAGAYGPAPGTAVAPVVAGLDAAGEVLEIGERVQGVRPGDRVMTLADGGLAEQVVVDAGLAVPVPGDWSYVEGAAAILGLLSPSTTACARSAVCSPVRRC